MKSKYLDIRNCHALLPSGYKLPTVQRLEECLDQINSQGKGDQGLIDSLIEHNKKTSQMKSSTRRLVNVPLDIAQGVNAIERSIHTQAMVRPEPSPLLFNMAFEHEMDMTWKVILPLQYLLKGWGDANSGHQCYVHSICRDMPRTGTIQQLVAREADQSQNYTYVGITGRNWLLRLSEHMREIHNGNRRTFYQAWRDNLGLENVVFISQLSEINMSFDDAMNWEETLVDLIGSGENGLNMIPGGFKGLKNLHKLGIISKERVTVEERDAAINEFIRQHPRKGIPNPFIAKLWEDDSHYSKVLESKKNLLSVEQVRRIRELARAGWAIDAITSEVDAINEQQVKKVIAGQTYNRGEYADSRG